MSWLRTIVGAALLIPSVGCTMCCSPYDTCGPLCNGECGCGCPETARAGGYYQQTSYYEEVPASPRRTGPTLAPPRELPRTEPQSPADTMPSDSTYESPSNSTLPETEPSSPTDAVPETTPYEMPSTDDTSPPSEDTAPPAMDENPSTEDPLAPFDVPNE